MKLLHHALLLSFVLFFSHSITAQTRKVSCPSLKLSGVNQTVIEGDVITLNAGVTGKNLTSKVTFHWVLSAGEILNGQGTNTIQIRTDNLGGDYITVTVEVKGLPAACTMIQSESFAIKTGCPTFKLETPPVPVEEGQLAVLTASVTGNGARHVTFHWMVSAGKIRRGQATAMIEVDTSKLGGVGILAAVELGGLAPACRTSEVVAVMIAKKGNKKAKRQIISEE